MVPYEWQPVSRPPPHSCPEHPSYAYVKCPLSSLCTGSHKPNSPAWQNAEHTVGQGQKGKKVWQLSPLLISLGLPCGTFAHQQQLAIRPPSLWTRQPLTLTAVHWQGRAITHTASLLRFFHFSALKGGERTLAGLLSWLKRRPIHQKVAGYRKSGVCTGSSQLLFLSHIHVSLSLSLSLKSVNKSSGEGLKTKRRRETQLSSIRAVCEIVPSSVQAL